MPIYQLKDRIPVIGKKTYLHQSADIIGDVTIGENCFIGPGARLRGDYGRIVIGDGTSVEDNCVIHARPDDLTTVGKLVTLGHGSIIHNATIHDFAVIGMGAIVSDWAVIEEWGVIGEGAVVKNKQVILAGRIAVGIPAKVIGNITDEYKAEWTRFKQIYVDLAVQYSSSLKPI